MAGVPPKRHPRHRRPSGGGAVCGGARVGGGALFSRTSYEESFVIAMAFDRLPRLVRCGRLDGRDLALTQGACPYDIDYGIWRSALCHVSHGAGIAHCLGLVNFLEHG